MHAEYWNHDVHILATFCENSLALARLRNLHVEALEAAPPSVLLRVYKDHKGLLRNLAVLTCVRIDIAAGEERGGGKEGLHSTAKGVALNKRSRFPLRRIPFTGCYAFGITLEKAGAHGLHSTRVPIRSGVSDSPSRDRS